MNNATAEQENRERFLSRASSLWGPITEGLTMEELSEVLARTNRKSNKFSSAREHLRQNLIEAGCTFIIMNDTVKKGHSHGR